MKAPFLRKTDTGGDTHAGSCAPTLTQHCLGLVGRSRSRRGLRKDTVIVHVPIKYYMRPVSFTVSSQLYWNITLKGTGSPRVGIQFEFEPPVAAAVAAVA